MEKTSIGSYNRRTAMELKLVVILVILAITCEIIAGQNVPEWCRRRSPRLNCLVNPCDHMKCRDLQHAVCLNDNPCEPACIGHFYIEGKPRLTKRECKGKQRKKKVKIPRWCPNKNPNICKENPCRIKKCPAYPLAVCLNSDPCDPNCIGEFYLGRRQLTDKECEVNSNGVPSWCPKGSPKLRCIVNPCQILKCEAVQEARCINDNACEPACFGNFYLHGRKLTPQECTNGINKGS